MKGLLWKDFYLMKKIIKAMLLIIILFAFIGWQDKSSQMMIAIIPVFTLLTISLFNYDQSSHFDLYAMTLPITPAIYVVEKLIFGILLSIIASFISFFFITFKSTSHDNFL